MSRRWRSLDPRQSRPRRRFGTVARRPPRGSTRSGPTSASSALTPFITLYAREGADGQAVVCPLLRGSSPTRWVAPKVPGLTSFVTLTRARARQWSARCYGVARQRDGSRQNSIGVSGVLSLRHFGLAGSLYPLARGCRRTW